MVLFSIAVICTFVVMFWLCLYLFEVNNGPKLDEQVTVKCRQHHVGRMIYTGHAVLAAPPSWTLSVANNNGSGTVRVSQAMYESISEGDTIRVRGTRGRSNGRWYLREVLKETAVVAHRE